MDPAELESFELHLLACESCRVAVRTGAATRVALRDPADSTVRVPSTRRFGWMVAAAAIVAITVLATRQGSESPLGDIVPAPFVAGAVRPAPDSVSALVDSGMAAYARSDFRTASQQLARAAAIDPSPPVAFFLGVSLLMNHEDRAALDPLATAANATPYATEAAYYRAKAFVRLRQPDSALAVLSRALAVEASPQLAALADSIRGR